VVVGTKLLLVGPPLWWVGLAKKNRKWFVFSFASLFRPCPPPLRGYQRPYVSVRPLELQKMPCWIIYIYIFIFSRFPPSVTGDRVGDGASPHILPRVFHTMRHCTRATSMSHPRLLCEPKVRGGGRRRGDHPHWLPSPPIKLPPPVASMNLLAVVSCFCGGGCARRVRPRAFLKANPTPPPGGGPAQPGAGPQPAALFQLRDPPSPPRAFQKNFQSMN